MKAKSAEVLVYEPTLNESSFFGRVLTDLEEFEKMSDVIVVNQ